MFCTQKYISKIKEMLLEDMCSDGDVSPNGMHAIGALSQQYQRKVSQNVIDSVIERSRWIQTYFTHCRHNIRPIDTVLIKKLIDAFDIYG